VPEYDYTTHLMFDAITSGAISQDKKMNLNRRAIRPLKRCLYLLLLCASLLAVSLACNLTARSGELNATITAVVGQQTSLAGTALAFTQQASGITPQPLTQEPPAPQITPTPGPTRTVVDLLAPMRTPSIFEPDERLLKSAKILLFEDMSASRYIRLVKEALDKSGYFYLDVGSAKGWFKNQLLSAEDWDLVIAAAEAERGFGGEFFQYIDQRVSGGTAAIIENWDLDSAPTGMARTLLDRCGVQVEADWFQPDLRVFFWLVPDHPIFHQPNELPHGLRNAQPVWPDDVGDLLKLRQSNGQQQGDAILLAGTNYSWKTDHGLLATCLGGRMILQTFRSHEYHHDDMVALWQNYIYNALKSYFNQTGRNLPTPVTTVLPTMDVNPTPSGPTPGPDYTFPHDCGGLMRARLVQAPFFQRDLFEHHAEGMFMILRLELDNLAGWPIQMWDGDYFVEASVGGRQVTYTPNKAATGYLYIESPTNLYQDLIQPGETWRTSLAFDVDQGSANWVLILRPGSEAGEQVCEVKIPLTR
jgi:hypothetical protein